MSMESDLYFFFTTGLGLQGIDYSTFSSTNASVPVEPWFGTATYSDANLRAQFRNVRRYRRISKRYFSLSPSIRDQLVALCDPQYRYPPELLSVFGKKNRQGNLENGKTGLAFYTKYGDDLSKLIKICQSKEFKQEVEFIYKSLKEEWNASAKAG